MRDLDKELDEWRDIQPESWKPQPGDKIVGEVLRYDQAGSQYGPCWLVVLKIAANGDHGDLAAVWLSHKVLLERFRALRPKPGERVAIKRLTDGEGSHGNYARYAVIVDRPGDGAPDWDSVCAAEDEPPF